MTEIEKQIIECVNASIGEAIRSRLTGYSSPLIAQIDSVVSERGDMIRQIVKDSFEDALTGELRESLRKALAHKLAKILVSKMEGEIEKRVNDLRSNPATRAAITLAVESAISKL